MLQLHVRESGRNSLGEVRNRILTFPNLHLGVEVWVQD
jgi:hypothetical protein